VILTAAPAAAQSIVLVDRARDAGLGAISFVGDTWHSAAVAFLDLDGDGWPDLYFGASHDQVDVFCQNRRDGTFACAPTGLPPNATDVVALAAGDYDADGDLDLYVMRKGPNSLLANDGAAHFVDVTAKTKTAGDPGRPITPSGTFFDYDGDGRLDLYLGHWYASDVTAEAHDQILRQNERGEFVDVTVMTGIDDGDRSTLAMLVVDYDEDGRPDVFLTGDFAEAQLFHNEGGGRFVETTSRQPAGFPTVVREGMGIDAADLDGDGQVDLYVTGNKWPGGPTGSALFMNQGDGTFLSRSVELGVNTGYSWGTGLVDLDNNGWPDIFVATDVIDHHSMFLNQAGRAFVEQDLPGIQSGTNQCVTATFADYDNDGRVDVLLYRLDGHRPQLLHNETPSDAAGSHWLSVGFRLGHDSLGTRVRVTAGGRTQERQVLGQTSKGAQGDRRLHFGLGAATTADVEAIFPSGTSVRVAGLTADRAVVLDEIGVAAAPAPVPPPPHHRGCAVAIGGATAADRSAAAAPLVLAVGAALRFRTRRRRPARVASPRF
jgi:hypothetical protein